ncbi:MAG: threonine-phosphate decarboxylase CobD [Candidatus Thiodiazotropha sp.]|jgi:cobalamin biosynthesis protein CobC
MLEHGGNLRQAALIYKTPVNAWLDLSTGINPIGWPVPQPPASSWHRLPEESDGLEASAMDYYGCKNLLPVAGSQAAIQTLPYLRTPCRAGLITNSYAEHHHAWRSAGHQIVPLKRLDEIEQNLSQLDVLILVRPNNPTGECFPLERLLAWHSELAKRNGWLLVDEAFIDTTPEQSLIRQTLPGLIVLRSLGKFFGLAGARLGFVSAHKPLLRQLNEKLGPWTISGPSRWITASALNDRKWQEETRIKLQLQSKRLYTLLNHYGLSPNGGCALFQWVVTPKAQQIHLQLARQAILTRLFKQPLSLRFGLPGEEPDWQRLACALECCQ